MKNIKKTILWVLCGSLLLCAIVACGASQTTRTVPIIPIQLQYTPPQTLPKYTNLDYGVKVLVSDISSNDQVYNGIVQQTYSFTPTKESFVKESIKRHMRTMGFFVDQNSDADYVMSVSIETFNLYANIPNTGINLNITVYDPDRNIVYTTTAFGKPVVCNNNYFNKAYAKALEQIDWDAIAGILRRPKLPSQQQTAQVQGLGTTALEHTIINWEVTSRPAGADLYWRVISSTPDVKNTNKNYKSTTPYESTESFDIRGLTYQNSGDVQIELTCEKAGYLPQKKVFNVRMVLDQKSINAHFTLVKDE